MKVRKFFGTAALVALPMMLVSWGIQPMLNPTPVVVAPETPVVANQPAIGPTPGPVASLPSPPTMVDVAPRPAWVKSAALQAAVQQSMADFSGRYSVVVVDLKSGQSWSHQPNERYHPASTIKMPVTLYALDRYIAGELDWQDLITYTPGDFESPGGGAFETSPFGGRYPVQNLVDRALLYSNNVAVNMLGRHLGWENIRAFTRKINGELYRKPNAEPEVTAMSEVGWWLHLNKLATENPKAADLVLKPLSAIAYDGRIAAGLPPGVKYLHKFGSYDGYYHDGGTIYTKNPYVLVVMTHGGREAEADTTISRLSAAVYSVMVK